MKSAVVLLGLLVGINAMELTADNYDDATAGKTVFIKFLAPWWGHCKKMKPAWDKLMKEYEDSDSILIADVDCTAGGKSLCNSVGVKGYPTIKHGDPSDLQDYSGGRSASDLKKFAKTLKPSCSVANIELCDDEQKAGIEKIQAMSAEELEADIAKGDAEMAAAEETFKEEVEKLQAHYKELMEAKDAAIEAVKGSDYGLKKSVRAAQKKAAKQAAKEEL